MGKNIAWLSLEVATDLEEETGLHVYYVIDIYYVKDYISTDGLILKDLIKNSSNPLVIISYYVKNRAKS